MGGMASRQLTSDFLQQVVEWKKAGHRLVIVHGGGFAINKLMADHSLPVKKINGLRITRQSDMELIHHALIEQVGAEISQKFLQES
ncbi:amino acid kinase family protein, partial [Streptococcus pyogenes]